MKNPILTILIIIKTYPLNVTRHFWTWIIPTGLITTITLPTFFVNYSADLLNDLIYFQKAIKRTTIMLIIVTPVLQLFHFTNIFINFI